MSENKLVPINSEFCTLLQALSHHYHYHCDTFIFIHLSKNLNPNTRQVFIWIREKDYDYLLYRVSVRNKYKSVNDIIQQDQSS
jgi:hypothetical protein